MPVSTTCVIVFQEALLYVITVIVVLRFFARVSISRLSPFAPRCRRDHLELDVPGTAAKITRRAVVRRGRGRVARAYVDDTWGFQHTVVVWGLMRLFPGWLLMLMYGQVEAKIRGKRTFLSISPLPCSHVHLIDFPRLAPGDRIDLAGAQIVEVRNETGSIRGATDLHTWIHHNCAWIAPAGADLASVSILV